MALKKWMSGKGWGRRAERKEAQNHARRVADRFEVQHEESEAWWKEWDSRNAEIEKNITVIEDKINEGWTLQWVPPEEKRHYRPEDFDPITGKSQHVPSEEEE